MIGTARNYPGQPDRAGAVNIPAALVASDHAPSGDHYRPLPQDGTSPATSDISTLLWDGSRWAGAYYDGSQWVGTYVDGSRWGAAEWDGSRWAHAYWNGSRWAHAYWNGSRWGGSAWDTDTSLD